jgi:hypothetical protein
MIIVLRLLAVLMLLVASSAHAHSASTSYLQLTPDERGGAVQWRIALRDLDALLELDTNGDGQLAWGEVADRRADIAQLAAASLRLERGGVPCALHFDALGFERLGGSSFAVLGGRGDCARGAAPLQLRYGLFAGIDPSHRALLTLPASPKPVLLAPLATATASGEQSAAVGFADMFIDGLHHIVSGIDHALFLVALLLPAVVERRDGRWQARRDLKRALLGIVWIATAFTVAHSITLGLASFGVVRVPGSVIEPLVAVTVLAAALNNLWPVVTRRLSWLAFGFGLIHGFAFAEVLAPLELATSARAWALAAFNLGVEGGQLIVIAACFAVLAALRGWPRYPRWILGGGSCALAVVAAGWIVERVFNVTLIG